VVEHAQHLEKQAAKALGEAHQRLQEAQAQLQQLNIYRQEYNDRFHQFSHNSPGPQRLLDYQAFMAKLNEAVAQQTVAIETAERSLHEVKQFWLAKRGRSKALDGVLNGYLAAEAREAERKEQRANDDLHRPKTTV